MSNSCNSQFEQTKKWRNEDSFDRKTLISSRLWSNSFWKPFENVSITAQYEKTPTQNLKHGKETLYSNQNNCFHQYSEVKENLYPNSFINIWTLFAFASGQQQVQDTYASQKVQVFSRDQKHIFGARRATNEKVQ